MLKFIKHSIACIALFSYWHVVSAMEQIDGAESLLSESSQQSCEGQQALSELEHNNIDFSFVEPFEKDIDVYSAEFDEENVYVNDDKGSSDGILPQHSGGQGKEKIIEKKTNKKPKPELIEWMLQRHKLPSLHFLDVLEFIDN